MSSRILRSYREIDRNDDKLNVSESSEDRRTAGDLVSYRDGMSGVSSYGTEIQEELDRYNEAEDTMSSIATALDDIWKNLQSQASQDEFREVFAPSVKPRYSSDITTSPLIMLNTDGMNIAPGLPKATSEVFPAQFGLLGSLSDQFETGVGTNLSFEWLVNGIVLANLDAPWSAFICGSQGAGKSHTLSCLLENGLLHNPKVNQLTHPLATMVFHYDNYTSQSCSQLCEAAYLCSAGIPVTVLVSPSNIWNMTELYSNMPGLSVECPRPKVLPLYLAEASLDISTMLKLMAVDPTSDTVPLYMETVMSILREMAMEGKGTGGFSYTEFRTRIDAVTWVPGQRVPLDLRLQLLDSFLEPSEFTRTTRPASSSEDIWSFPPGTLTIVDLSDPFVGSNDACSLFSICLSRFLENRKRSGRIVALDEAHKFLSQSGAARALTDDLTSVIRQQRHTGTRVYIATQEPTLSPALIDLCNATFVHRFLSPAWFEALKGHLAGAGKNDTKRGQRELFEQIVDLDTGDALLFCPTAVVIDKEEHSSPADVPRLGSSYVKISVRSRVTYDGGRSLLATEAATDVTVDGEKPEILMHIVNKEGPAGFGKPAKKGKRPLRAVEPASHTGDPSFFHTITANNQTSSRGLPITRRQQEAEPMRRSTMPSDSEIQRVSREQMRIYYRDLKWHSINDIMWKRFTIAVELACGLEQNSLKRDSKNRYTIRSAALDEHRKCREQK